MTEIELEDKLSQPYEEDRAAVRALSGPLLILGCGGKMGPSLAHRAVRAGAEVIAVSRFSDAAARQQLESWGVRTIAADLLERGVVDRLPDAQNVIYMAARKFGTEGNNAETWVTNAFLPGLVAQRYPSSRIVAFSTGNVYPFSPVDAGGSTEDTRLEPVGEYGQSALARERVFDHFSRSMGTPVALLRLNYAVELRYGVLAEIARKVYDGEAVDLTMGYVNVIWQGDANSVCLRSFRLCGSPAVALNLTGPETLRVRELALAFGRKFGIEPQFSGAEAPMALLSNAARCSRVFGAPRVGVAEMMDWIVDWTNSGGRSLNKPTHFEARDGKF